MRCEQCPTAFCQYRRRAGECIRATNVLTTPDTRTYELLRASHELIEAVEKYIQPKKGEFLSRIELLVVLRKVKKIINEDK